MKTVKVKAAEIKKNWVLVDASDLVLGRLASQIAHVLRGKHKPTFVPHWDCGDYVVVTNAAKVKLTGNKKEKKQYYHHSGYVGGIKEISAKRMLETKPEQIVRLAVKRMLPKNKLASKVLQNLKIFSGAEHNLQAQKPVPMPPRTAKGE